MAWVGICNLAPWASWIQSWFKNMLYNEFHVSWINKLFHNHVYKLHKDMAEIRWKRILQNSQNLLKMCDYHKWEQNTANWKYYRTKLLIATCIAILTSISSVGSLLLLSTICKKVRTDDFKWIELIYRKCSKLAKFSRHI